MTLAGLFSQEGPHEAVRCKVRTVVILLGGMASNVECPKVGSGNLGLEEGTSQQTRHTIHKNTVSESAKNETVNCVLQMRLCGKTNDAYLV